MKFTGGYNIRLPGRPGAKVSVLPEPKSLYIPLSSERFTFSKIAVKQGQRVHPGDVLARDPDNFSVPLLAPRGGTVDLESVAAHIVLENIAREPEERYHPHQDGEHVPKGTGSAGMKRYKLMELGAWQFFHDAHTMELPSPFSTPQAIIVSTLRLEPFHARGNVQIHKRLLNFTRGLEHLQSLLEFQPIYLVLPDVDSPLAHKIMETLRGYAWVKPVQVPFKYPYDHFTLLARRLGLKKESESPVWALGTDGVLAVERALTLSRPSTVRIISLGGPDVETPVHLKAVPGYPLDLIFPGRTTSAGLRIVDGGVLTGRTIGPDQMGISAECSGLTVLPRQKQREFLGFLRPGWKRVSYSSCFPSSLNPGAANPGAAEILTTSLRGERRPCVSCGYCEEVCPAGIMPHLIHKLMYQDRLEEAEAVRTDLCMACGLCSFVCPSKIELCREILDAQKMIKQELHGEEVAV